MGQVEMLYTHKMERIATIMHWYITYHNVANSVIRMLPLPAPLKDTHTNARTPLSPTPVDRGGGGGRGALLCSPVKDKFGGGGDDILRDYDRPCGRRNGFQLCSTSN